MNQHAGAEFEFGALQGAFELLTEIDGAVLDHHRADGQYPILVHVQPGGFQIQHHPALFAQAAFVQPAAAGKRCKRCCNRPDRLAGRPGAAMKTGS
jgi:hypothetical protein